MENCQTVEAVNVRHPMVKGCRFSAVLGVSENHTGSVLKGRKNFSLDVAKRAAALCGGDVVVWLDKKQTEKRLELFRKFEGIGGDYEQ